MKKTVIGLSAILLAGGVHAVDEGKKIAWMDKGKQAVKEKLKDAESAQFKGVFFNQGADGVPVTCGQVNSKNSFGGYGGYQRFVSAGKPELTWLEEGVADFSTVWTRLCQ